MVASLARKFMTKMWADDRGYAHLAEKPAPEIKGPETFRPFTVKWPEEAARVWSWLEDRSATHGLF